MKKTTLSQLKDGDQFQTVQPSGRKNNIVWKIILKRSSGEVKVPKGFYLCEPEKGRSKAIHNWTIVVKS